MDSIKKYYSDGLFMLRDAIWYDNYTDRIIAIDDIAECVKTIGSTGGYTIYTLFPDGRVEKR